MAKRISTEARLLDWIDSADIAIVTTILGIANARVKARVRKEQPQVVKVRKPRVGGVNTATAFPGTSEVRSV